MNRKGVGDIVGALGGLLLALITYYTVFIVWQPITTTALYPLLENAEAFPYGATTITILNVIPLIAGVAIFIVFFQQATKGDRQAPPPYYS